MSELSIFVDESGSDDLSTKYYLVALVFHDQSDPIVDSIARYEMALRDRGLPNIPFHAGPLMNGKDDYEFLDLGTRKRLLASFFVFARSLPISYKAFAYRSSEVGRTGLARAIEGDVTSFLRAGLGRFQSYGSVKIYYDGGQGAVTEALHRSVEAALSKSALVFRKSSATQYRLSQVADFICTVELTAIKFAASEQTSTDGKVFGMRGAFKKNYLRKVRRLSL